MQQTGEGNVPDREMRRETDIQIQHRMIEALAEKARLESGLRESERRLNALLDANSESSLLLTTEGDILAINAVAAGRLRLNQAGATGRNVFGCLPPGLAETRRARLQEVVSTGAPAHFLDGCGNRSFENHLVPVKDETGMVAGVAVFAKDVTGRQRAERAIADSERKYRALFETANDGIFLQNATAFLDCNEKGASMYGLAREEVIGKSPADLCPERQPDGRLSSEVAAEKIAAAMRGETTCFEWRPLRADGTPFDVEITLSRVDYRGDPCLQAIVRDIGKRKEAENELRLAASVFRSSQEGIMIAGADRRIVDVNDAFTRITGYSRAEVLHRTPELLSSGHHGPDFYSGMRRALDENGHWQGEVWNRRRDGELYAQRLTISTVRDQSGRLAHYVALMSDITKAKQYEERLERIAHYDALTGIPNRVLLADRMHQAIAQTQRNRSRLAVCYLDLDGFKPINDTYGHDTGDRVLVEMAERLRSCLRGGDTIARLGGDEFVLLLLGLDRDDEIDNALQRVLDTVARPLVVAGQAVSLSVSIGVTLYPQDDADADTLLRHADHAMYRAKQAGKNRYGLFRQD